MLSALSNMMTILKHFIAIISAPGLGNEDMTLGAYIRKLDRVSKPRTFHASCPKENYEIALRVNCDLVELFP